MKAKFILSALLVASLSGCASTMSDDECHNDLGACLVVGTAQTVGYIAVAALVSSFDHHDDHRHDKKKRGR